MYPASCTLCLIVHCYHAGIQICVHYCAKAAHREVKDQAQIRCWAHAVWVHFLALLASHVHQAQIHEDKTDRHLAYITYIYA